MRRRLAFLDRDGTLIEHVHYLSDPEQVRLLPGTIEGLQGLRERGFALVLVSNQSGVGRGYFSREQVEAVNERMQSLLRPHQAQLDLLLYCPHQPQDGCSCRKPHPGMALQASEALGLNLEGALVVGDADCDMGLAESLGLPGYRIGSPALPRLDRLLDQLQRPL